MSDAYALSDRDEPSLSSWERALYDDVSRSEPWSLVEEFADLRRLSPSADERRSAEILTDRFDAYGVPYERYDPEFWLSVPEAASVRVPDAGAEYAGREDDFEAEAPTVKALAFSNDETVSGEVVAIDVPDAEDADDVPGTEPPDLSAYDLAGKVVLVDAMILAKEVLREIETQGASALVMIHPAADEPHSTTATPVWGAIPRPDQRDMIPDMVYAVVGSNVGSELLEYANEEGVEFEVTADVDTGWYESPLVVARIPGEAELETADFALLHGHLDSWYYGVTDNATGNAGMIEVARVLNEHRDRLKRDLWIAFWPAHEGGRYGGSTWFVDEFAHELYERCVAHVNFDSPGVEDATEFTMTNWHIEGDDLCKGVIDDVTGKDASRSRPPRSGDCSFYNIGVTGLKALSSGIPAELREERGYHAVGGSGGNSDAWHRTTDTIEAADPDVLVRDIRVYVVLLARVLSADVLPFDYRRTVESHRETVAAYDDAAGSHYDLGPVLAELGELEDALEQFYAAVDDGSVPATEANDAFREVSRRLVPLDFTTDGRFQQDPATYRPPYPSLRPAVELPELDGDDYRFRKRNLDRAVNEAVHELRLARRALP